MKTITIAAALMALALPAMATAIPTHDQCIRAVIGKRGNVLYCTRDLSPAAGVACDCMGGVAAADDGGDGMTYSPRPKPRPPAMTPVDDGDNDGPDLPTVPENPADPVEPPADPEPDDQTPPTDPVKPADPKPEPKPDAPKDGQNPGNDKPVGGAPHDGEKGEEPSGKPKEGKQ